MRFRIIPVTSYQQNCSLLMCEKTQHAAIVDPGGDIDLILSIVEQEKVSPQSILLTHGHLDHVGGAAQLAAKLGIPIMGPHVGDLYWLDGLPEQSKMFGFPPCPKLSPTRWLKQGDVIKFGEESLEVFHCPGHTPGHLVFLNREAKLATVGDVLFKGSIGRSDFPGGDYDTLIASIKQTLWPLGKDIAFIPGHGPMSKFGEEMRTNPYVHI
jgi:glyoxylase-like metal-dependent hydrolase (beta-lactamase superfamily II)